jgi:probable rRNA maturation factor
LILNRQKQYAPNLPALRACVRGVRRGLRLGRRDFNLCLVSDREIQRLNAAFRALPRPTDVLSFPWHEAGKGSALPSQVLTRSRRRKRAQEADGPCQAAFRGFLGDVVISVETARRNARTEGHSTLNEIRWLVLHGVLHLLGYDHERDRGEMTRLELALREKLGLAGPRSKRRLRKQAK